MDIQGIYFPQMGWWAWTRVIAENRRTIFKLVKEVFSKPQRPTVNELGGDVVR